VTFLPLWANSDMVGTVPGTSENATTQGQSLGRGFRGPVTCLAPDWARNATPRDRSRRRVHAGPLATIVRVTEESAQPLEQQLEEIRTQLAWVRDYL
jgi:hypothetical protein